MPIPNFNYKKAKTPEEKKAEHQLKSASAILIVVLYSILLLIYFLG